jgi:hypothetical protein
LENRQTIAHDFYALLDKNKTAFEVATSPELDDAIPKHKGGANDAYILKRLKAKEIRHYHGFTEDDELYIQRVIQLLTDGALPRPTTKKVTDSLKKMIEPLKVLGILRRDIPSLFFQASSHINQSLGRIPLLNPLLTTIFIRMPSKEVAALFWTRDRSGFGIAVQHVTSPLFLPNPVEPPLNGPTLRKHPDWRAPRPRVANLLVPSQRLNEIPHFVQLLWLAQSFGELWNQQLIEILAGRLLVLLEISTRIYRMPLKARGAKRGG